MTPSVKHWRSKTFSVVMYLDDSIYAHQNFSLCEEQSLLVWYTILSVLYFCPTRTSVTGSHSKSFTGWAFVGILSAIRCLFRQRRFLGLMQKCITGTLSCRSITARKLARVTGRIISSLFNYGQCL